MVIFLVLAGFFIVALVAMGLYAIATGQGDQSGAKEKSLYQYTTKKFLLTRAERECFDTLIAAVGNEFHIFPQVHPSAIIDNKVVGQNWKVAFRHINGKSVDFVLCDKAYVSPKLAIELDDKTHERPDRIERDVEVERMLKEAGLPLLRLRSNDRFDQAQLAARIRLFLV